MINVDLKKIFLRIPWGFFVCLFGMLYQKNGKKEKKVNLVMQCFIKTIYFFMLRYLHILHVCYTLMKRTKQIFKAFF